MILIYLSSGLFLGWSLGANDAANIFGTAVGTKMIRFKKAAIICGIFVIIGAVFSGAGTTETLGKLGSITALAGAFMVATAAGFTVFVMTRMKLPVSTSQAIVGAIIGWNLFAGATTDYAALKEIVLTWIFCPVLAAIFAIVLYLLVRSVLGRAKIHLLVMDDYTRLGLIIVGAFGAYSLGANNIANVMGVFVPIAPFQDLIFNDIVILNGAQQLFLLGGIAIAVGAYTYSRKVMETVGGSLLKLSPVTALIVVLAQALVLFVFSSRNLELWLTNLGLPSFPLVPVSSSHAVVGAVVGIGIIKGVRGIKYRVLGEIAIGWVITPIAAGIITFISLFFLQNVFSQKVYEPINYDSSEAVLQTEPEQKSQMPTANIHVPYTYLPNSEEVKKQKISYMTLLHFPGFEKTYPSPINRLHIFLPVKPDLIVTTHTNQHDFIIQFR
jgi:PiT family inorganic phosphate transporter